MKYLFDNTLIPQTTIIKELISIDVKGGLQSSLTTLEMRFSVVQEPKPSAYKVQLRRALFSVPRGGRAKASAIVRSPSSTPSSATKICEVRTQERQRLQKVRRVYIPQALLHTDRCLIQENHSDHEFRTIIFFFHQDRDSLAWALPSWLGWLTSKPLRSTCLCLPNTPPHPAF